MINFRILAFRELIKLQFIKFLFVGFINSLFGYGCFALFLYMGLHYTLALLLATIYGVIFNFKSTGVLVFASHNNRLIFRFVGFYTIIYFINVVGIKAFNYVGVTPYISAAILILPVALISYLFNRRFVFNYV
jgi:putative flippase GtrA